MRHDIRGRHHRHCRKNWREMLAQRVQRRKHPDCDSGDAAGKVLNDGNRETSDAREPQKGKREIGATAIGAASWGEKSGVTPQNQDESRNNEVQGTAVGPTGATTPAASPR